MRFHVVPLQLVFHKRPKQKRMDKRSLCASEDERGMSKSIRISKPCVLLVVIPSENTVISIGILKALARHPHPICRAFYAAYHAL